MEIFSGIFPFTTLPIYAGDSKVPPRVNPAGAIILMLVGLQ